MQYRQTHTAFGWFPQALKKYILKTAKEIKCWAYIRGPLTSPGVVSYCPCCRESAFKSHRTQQIPSSWSRWTTDLTLDVFWFFTLFLSFPFPCQKSSKDNRCSVLPRKCQLGSEWQNIQYSGESELEESAVCRSEWCFNRRREKESEVTTHPAPGTFWDPPREPSLWLMVKAFLPVRTWRRGRNPPPSFRIKYTFLPFLAVRP